MISIYDANGFVTNLTSSYNYIKAIDIVTKFTGISDLTNFMNEGTTVHMQDVIKDIDKILPSVTDECTREILSTLKEGLGKSEAITIVS